MAHKPPFHPDRRLFPFDSKWFQSPVGPVHYIDEGSGPPIFFLHGNPTWSFLYRGIVIRLKRHFRCIAVDLPGFGLSVRPEDYDYTPADHAGVVSALVRHLDLKNLTIMGHEWGGPIGMRVAVDDVPRIRALVMGNTWYWPLDAWYVKTFAYVMTSAPMQTQILRHNFYVEKVMPAAVKYPFAEEVLHHYREALPTPKSRIGVAEFPRQLIEASPWLGDLTDEVREKLSAIPVLLTWGIDDVAFPRHFMERFREDFDEVTIHRLDAKHYIQEDAPGEIAQAIEAFLTGLQP